jgi:uncharacterized protein DUF1552
MNPKTRSLSRRTFLRGAGAMIALPFFESLLPVRAASAVRPPKRAAFLYFPNGVWPGAWIPKKTGTDFELTFSLTPLEKLKQDVIVLSGLDKAQSRDGDGHYAKTANFLTGLHVQKTIGKDINVGGVSVDQVVAQKFGDQTPLPSLELGIDPVISGTDSVVGYTRLYGSYISWRTAGAPLAKEINPRMVYERLFGAKDAARGRDDDRSLLDLTLEDARNLRGRLGRDDLFKLDEYLDAIRAVERRLEFSSKPDPRPWKPSLAPDAATPPTPGIPHEHREHVKLMLDLMVLAFWSDSTRVITFMFANDVSNKNFSFVEGVRGSHHDMSHHSNKPDKIEQYQRIARWHVEQFAYLLNKMKAIREGEATLLDNAMVMFGSSLSDGNRHDPNNLPILLGGRAGGTLQTGRHIASPKNTPLCNLYVSMLQRMDLPVKSFGDSSGPLAGLS